MKDAKILLIIKNVDTELAAKIQKVINEHNASILQKKASIVSADVMPNEKRD
jgi:hypothetical protein